MVNVTQYAEGQYLNNDIVKKSPSKKCIIMGEGREDTSGKYGPKFVVDVQIDGKNKIWNPGKDNISNLMNAYGADSRGWNGNTVNLQVLTVNSKEQIIATGDIVKVEDIPSPKKAPVQTKKKTKEGEVINPALKDLQEENKELN